VQQHLGVGVVRAEAVAPGLEFAAQRGVLVDLPVEDDADLAVFGPHGLGAGGRVHHGQPPMAQVDGPLRVAPRALGVGPPVGQGVGHALQVGRAAVAGEAGDAAHHSSASRFRVWWTA
jgi:hypothetical protein